MTDIPKKKEPISRRKILPILGSSLLIPLFGFGNSQGEGEEPITDSNSDAYETLIKPDGTTVKVKVSSLKNSRVIKKNISNKTFLNWIGRKF